MTRLLVRRVLLAIPLVFIVSILTFLLVAITPGNPAYDLLGTTATPAEIRALDAKLELNKPVFVQYWHWLYKVLHGDLGTSLFSLSPVGPELNHALGVTLTLLVGATLLAGVVGVTLGTVSAIYSRRLGKVTDVLAMLGFSIPNFLLATFLVLILAVKFRIFPATGFVPFSVSPYHWFLSLVMPVVALGLAGTTAIAKNTRDAMNDVMNREFIDALRADGVSERSIIFKHALRSAAIPIITVLGLVFVASLGGAALVESVFVLPGLGTLLVQAVIEHDLPVIEGVALYFTLIVVVANLIIDVLYGWLNPKARMTG